MENPFDFEAPEEPKKKLDITMAHWRSMHPSQDSIYQSDKYYLGIAQRIADILVQCHFNELYPEDYNINVALCLAAYFEDVVSELGLFRAFVHGYRENFDREFPWYTIEEEYYEDEVNFVDVRLVLWLSMYANSHEKVPNPENPDAEKVARAVYGLLEDEFEKAPVNQRFVDRIYNKRVLGDPGELKAIFMWMASSCYLLRITEKCQEVLQSTFEELNDIFQPAQSNPYIAHYLNSSYAAFNQRRGPLALYPKEWYVRMRQIKGLTEGNEDILKMDITGVYPFAIVKNNSKTYILRTCGDLEYEVNKNSFSKTEIKGFRVGDILVTMLFSYKGLWNVCGFAMSSNIHDIDTALEKVADITSQLIDPFGYQCDLTGKGDEHIPGNSTLGPTFDSQKCEAQIRDNNGDRMFYFSGIKQTDKWVEKQLDPPSEYIPERNVKSKPIALYITDDYHLLTCECAQMVHDPSNPYYSSKYDYDFLGVITDTEMIANEMVEYMLDNNYTDRIYLNSIHGEEHGRKLLQDNIRFFLTFSRQYPFYDSKTK